MGYFSKLNEENQNLEVVYHECKRFSERGLSRGKVKKVNMCADGIAKALSDSTWNLPIPLVVYVTEDY